MPRYHFDVWDADGFHGDDVGDEFDDLAQATDQARALLPDIARDKLPGDGLHRVSCDVRDESGAVVYRCELTLRGTDLAGPPAAR